jgi:hypothetical protein
MNYAKLVVSRLSCLYRDCLCQRYFDPTQPSDMVFVLHRVFQLSFLVAFLIAFSSLHLSLSPSRKRSFEFFFMFAQLPATPRFAATELDWQPAN